MRILHLDIDTLRADHLGCYGYHRNTSPHLDSIAAQGIRFDKCYCSDAPCAPSRAALMSGRFGIHTGLVNHGGQCADMRLDGARRGFRDWLAHNSLPALLREIGFKTVSISPFAERHGQWTFYAGFNEMHNTGAGGMESAEEITPTVMQWIEANAASQDWYLHVNYWDPHTPYRAPAEFGNPFANDPLPDWITPDVLAAHQQMVGPHCAREIAMWDNRENPKYPRHPGEVTDMASLRRLIDGYDCGVRYADAQCGKILEALARKGVSDDLMIIVSSDHGENLGELGIYSEHATADAITTRIPLIIRWPENPRTGKTGAQAKIARARAPLVDIGLHYQLDLAPTLTELFGREPKPRWDGRSYAPAILGVCRRTAYLPHENAQRPALFTGEIPQTTQFSDSLLEGRDCGREYLVVSQCAHVCQRAVRFGDWMYIRTWHDGFHLFPNEMLFNVEEDPHEQRNEAEMRPEICCHASRLLDGWHDEMMKSSDSEVDPLWTVMREGGPMHANGQLAKYCEYLKSTGRAWAIPELKRRHPQEFRKGL
ncbi:MAG: sulfatase [Candidatus Sumerlaeota bacterium]|nr:sulfatase [Candidatus Sumerlaeota bacterium]